METGREALRLVGEAAQRLFGLPGFGQEASENFQRPDQIGFKRSCIPLSEPTPNLDGLPNHLQRALTITHFRQPTRKIAQRPRQL